MIKAVSNYFASIPAVFIDGMLLALVAWFTFNQAYFGGDEAAKFITPMTKFWLNWGIGSGAIVCGSIKSFRSTAYADHQKKKDGETQPPVIT